MLKQRQAPLTDQTDAQGGQVMTRGPVHEAFAAPVVHDPKAAPTIPKQPPAPIQEMPPDQKPAGQNVQWIPGYWSWDVSRNDFIWVSGIWREPPPNSQWVPGYWHQVDGGTSGSREPGFRSVRARRRASSRICRRRRRASRPARTRPSRRPT